MPRFAGVRQSSRPGVDAVPQHRLLRLARLPAGAEDRPTTSRALPSGTSVPHMFVVTFVVMLPILLRTDDPVQAWEAGLTWVFVQSFVLMAGGFIAPSSAGSRRAPPCSAALASISITFISMQPGLLVFSTPLIGMVCFAIILANWFGGVRYFRRAGGPDGDGGGHDHRLGIVICSGLATAGSRSPDVGDALSHFVLLLSRCRPLIMCFRTSTSRNHFGHRDSVGI